MTCPKCGGTGSLYSVETLIAHYPIVPTDGGSWEYTGGESRTFDETAQSEGLFWCDTCDTEFRA